MNLDSSFSFGDERECVYIIYNITLQITLPYRYYILYTKQGIIYIFINKWLKI